MHLAQRRTSNRLFFEFAENLMDRLPVLLLYRQFDVGVACGGGFVAHGFERFAVLVWYQLLELADHLTQFDVRAAVLAEAMEQTCGCCLMDFRCDILTSRQVIYPDHPGCVT